MQLVLIHNPDETQSVIYKIARVIYAETYMPTLAAAEALASLIKNISTKLNRDVADIANDKNVFSVLNPESPRHKYLSVDANNRAFQMCLRVTDKMLKHNLEDCCFGATKFHRTEFNPSWSLARGYILDMDGLLFYL